MHPETVLQINIVEALSFYSRQNNFLYFYIPNEQFFRSLKKGKGQGLTQKEAAEIMTLKKMGLLPGVSDLVVLKNGKAFCLEVKSAKREQSDNQILFQDWCDNHGIPYAIIRGVDEALRQLEEWGVIEK